MLAPHELKNKQFSKSLKGYNPQEVDAYIEFLLEKYTEAYRENNELERKLRIVVTNLDEIKDEEDSIRSTLISAQKMAEKIKADAYDRADIITGAIKDRCDGVIAEFRTQLQAEKEKAWIMRTRIIDFKKQVYELYGKHIEELKDLSVNEIEDIVLPNDDAIVAGIFTDVKDKIEQEIERRKKERELPPEEIKVEDPDVEERIALETANAENEEKVAAASDMPELSNEAKEAEDEYIKFMMGDNGAKE